MQMDTTNEALQALRRSLNRLGREQPGHGDDPISVVSLDHARRLRHILQWRDKEVDRLKDKMERRTDQDKTTFLAQILRIYYASFVVQLETRNRHAAYDYMSFSRRIGEFWESFCKLTFEYPVKLLSLISPPRFADVRSELQTTMHAYIEALPLSRKEKSELRRMYGIPWTFLDSGNVSLALDLHFIQSGVRYNCDFKSGFGSNEKGNTDRLLLIGSIYRSLGRDQTEISHAVVEIASKPTFLCGF